MADSIVVGYDGSDCAKAALEEAVVLAKRAGFRIVVAFGFHVWPGGGEIGDYRTALRQRGEELTAEGVAVVEKAGVEGESLVVEDAPAEALIRAAARAGAGLIVVGTRGERPLKGMILGSTPNKLLHQSTIPVLVVPVPEA